MVFAGSYTLTITNWVDTVDAFYASFFTGATGDSRGTGTAVNVMFNGYAGSDTLWKTGGEITPVPEPSAYGAILLALSLAAHHLRRRRG